MMDNKEEESKDDRLFIYQIETKQQHNSNNDYQYDLTTTQTNDIDDSLKEKNIIKRSESKKKKRSHDDFEHGQGEDIIYTENELKCKVKKELIVICTRLGIQSSINQLKDTIIQQIIKHQNDQQEFKSKMIDNNPLLDYNKGSLEYSLPWPIIRRIISQLWQESSICTCYYNQQIDNLIKENQNTNRFIYQKWPLCLMLWNESRMKCPMHTYHYFNDLDPSTNISKLIASTSNQKNKWRFQLLTISKRINQFISSRYLDNVLLRLNQDTLNHLNNQYCPIKTPKVLLLYNSNDLTFIGDQNTTIFNQVEKLKIHRVDLKPPNNKILPKIFKNIKSITATYSNVLGHLQYDRLCQKQFLSSFKNLTSINLQSCQHFNYNRDVFLTALTKITTGGGITKLLLPIDWCALPIDLDTKLADSIVNSNIIPPQQMPNLKTFHFYNYQMVGYTFIDTNLTTIVDHSHNGCPNINPFINNIPPTISTIKLKSGDEILKPLLACGLLIFNINKVLIDSIYEMTDQMINQFTKIGYKYHGATFKSPTTTKRQFTFIKSIPTAPKITKTKTLTISTTKKTTACSTNQRVITNSNNNNNNNPTLPFYLIEKIIKYSWHRYYCTCEPETNQNDSLFKKCQQLCNAKSKCPIHKNSAVLNLIKRITFKSSQVTNIQSKFTNQYCLLGKSIETLTLDIDDANSDLKFPQLDHYSNVSRLTAEIYQAEDSFPLLVEFKSLTSLDISQIKMYPNGLVMEELIDGLKDMSLKKLYFCENQIPESIFEDSSLSRSLESISINVNDMLTYTPRLFNLPKLRHIRIINNNHQTPFYKDLLTKNFGFPSSLPPGIQKISTNDAICTKICIHNPQVKELVYLEIVLILSVPRGFI
ncbi:hypothetical protein DFA_09218 [Cavenderia fasciculata]|uniref:Uncharacterized protein n=1 Tax=Cavenderia fasciculata TaxID=261658 RepID=F4Q708_CACFS|nr:uncharacterized protein DFA_09218 [Cavenderia fasciculata]EGG16190.1 hypothetical protein DFA_09218 [Cavenderia fasciculata]|eukprot:XP_004354574.1 hypothetical protein DFA_09218 [Cavenderia fasciculata]